MHISAKEHYGLRAIIELARRDAAGPVSLKEIASAQGISLGYLEQVMPCLLAAGLVNSTRGARGGYALARAPAEIVVGDVLRALCSGQIFDLQCMREADEGQCQREKVCIARRVWRPMGRQMIKELDTVTLAELSAEAEGRAGSGEQQQRVNPRSSLQAPAASPK